MSKGRENLKIKKLISKPIHRDQGEPAYANYSVVKRKNGAQTVLSRNAAKKKPFLT